MDKPGDHFSWIFLGISRDTWDCFLQEFRGDFLLNSRTWLKVTNLTGRTDLPYPLACQLQGQIKQTPSPAWECGWIDRMGRRRNLSLVCDLVFPWHSLPRAGRNWRHQHWHLKHIEPQAEVFAREEMQIRRNLVFVTLWGCATSTGQNSEIILWGRIIF